LNPQGKDRSAGQGADATPEWRRPLLRPAVRLCSVGVEGRTEMGESSGGTDAEETALGHVNWQE